MIDYCHKTVPFAHQQDCFIKSRDLEYYGLLLEQGCGKSKIIVDTSAYLYANGHIDAVLVIAPNGVQRNWVINEYPAHCPEYVDYSAAWYASSPTKKEEENLCLTLKHSGLKVVAMNIEAFATKKGVDFARKFLNCFRSMMVIDESSTIKSPKAIRTKNLLKLSVHAKYRRILTGTPVTQGPLDLYTQFHFLDSQILRCQSYFAFRNRYAVIQPMRMGNVKFDKVTGYQNTDELQRLIAPHSYRVTKCDCLDLPEKLYSKRYVELSVSQRKLYNQLKKEVLVEWNGKEMSAPLALTKLLRLQQIVGGFFQPDVTEISSPPTEEDYAISDGFGKLPPEPIDKVNPRVESLIELLEETNGKVIIWARFRAEIEAICSGIVKAFGERSCVEYHGGVENSIRSSNVATFQNEPEVRFFIGHVQAGGKGLTLHSAQTVVYFSNDFSLENRLQSEDRAHRIGQTKNVMYIDFIAPDTLDDKVVAALRSKKSIADLITGDADIGEWI